MPALQYPAKPVFWLLLVLLCLLLFYSPITFPAFFLSPAHKICG